MTDSTWNIITPAIRRRIAMVIAIVGIVFVASRLGAAWPRSVEVAYAVPPSVDELDADYLQSGAAVASVRFRQLADNSSAFRHIVRLRPGAYRVHITLSGQDGSAVEHVRDLSVPTSGVTRFDLRPNRAAPP